MGGSEMRGGLVYVKRDISNEEAPRTFDPAAANPLHAWIKWWAMAIKTSADQPLPSCPLSIKKTSVSRSDLSSARFLLLHHINNAGYLPVSRWKEIIKASSISLGFAWESLEGHNYTGKNGSWLEGGLDSSNMWKSGWVEWVTATMSFLKNAAVLRDTLPTNTVVEPWSDDATGKWAYGHVLNNWQANSRTNMPHANRWAELVVSIDQVLQANPSHLGLPLHWRVAARQVKCCIEQYHPDHIVALDDMGDLPPIHSVARLSHGRRVTGWMGQPEWIIASFIRSTIISRTWSDEDWQLTMKCMEKYLGRRGTQDSLLLAPFYAEIKDVVEKLFPSNPKIDVQPAVEHLAHIESWWISVTTAHVRPPASIKARRL